MATFVAATSAATLGLTGVVPSGAFPFHGGQIAGNAFTQTNLVSNIADQAHLTDPHLVNAWGLSQSPTSPIWVSDNNGVNTAGGPNVVTVYSGGVNGSAVTGPNLDVTIPGGRVSTGDSSSPTGQTFNSTTAFTVTTASGSAPATFIFDSESGQITAWNAMADPVTSGVSAATLEFSSPTAVFKGLAEATGPNGPDLFATNFHDGTVDVFNSNFRLITPTAGLFGFRDPSVPRGFAPFGIQAFPGNVPLLFVTYAKQDAAKHDSVASPAAGLVDVFTTSGRLVAHFARGGALDAPWGVAFVPANFGPFGGDVLVGDFGDGRINVFTLFGRFLGQMDNQMGQPITIDGLWGLLFGNAAFGGPGSLVFSAGPNNEHDGLLGMLKPAGS